MQTLFQTVHGSHLYGLSHEGSDYDTFRVVSDNPTVKGKYALQTINGTQDELVCDLGTFLRYSAAGVPQFCEALWSRQADIDLIRDLRFSFHPDYYQFNRTYQRTIRNFYAKPGLKFRRHAYRLMLNLLDFREQGWYDPTLDSQKRGDLRELVVRDIHPDHYLEGDATI